MKSRYKDTIIELFPEQRNDVSIISETEIGNIKLLGVDKLVPKVANSFETPIVKQEGMCSLFLTH